MYEVGYNQALQVIKILKKQGYNDIQIHKDLQNKDRIVMARIGMLM